MLISFMDWSRERIQVHGRHGKRLPSHRQGLLVMFKILESDSNDNILVKRWSVLRSFIICLEGYGGAEYRGV